MTLLVVAPKARADLAQTWRYSFERWGQPRADAYLDRIRQVLEVIAADPRRGTACDDVFPGYRRIGAGSHIVFFRVRPKDVYVVRILHEKMDFSRHL